jgi:hypothetical protein
MGKIWPGNTALVGRSRDFYAEPLPTSLPNFNRRFQATRMAVSALSINFPWAEEEWMILAAFPTGSWLHPGIIRAEFEGNPRFFGGIELQL